MPFVTPQELSKVLLSRELGPLNTLIGSFLLRITGLHQLNTHYDRTKHLAILPYLSEVLAFAEANYSVSEKDLAKIPKKGAFITISNHPLGLLDGIILMDLMLKIRPDTRFMTNFLLQRIAPLAPYLIPVNPFEKYRNQHSSLPGLKEGFHHLRSGGTVSIFPAGEVATKHKGIIKDKDWEPGIMKFIQKAAVPVIPIHFRAQNSHLFYSLAALHPVLRTTRIPKEFFSQKGKIIDVRIGKSILVEAQKNYSDSKSYTAFLRQKITLLGGEVSETKVKRTLNQNTGYSNQNSKIQSIANPVAHENIAAEIENCRVSNKRLIDTKPYEVFLAKKDFIPFIVQELGRLREITFRKVGEGTNQASDLDEFDAYYHHLILWDHEKKQLAGAYRIGLGSEIYTARNTREFYLQKLFHFDSKLRPMLQQTIEIGRAFVVSEYQQRPLPLFLLWKGIVQCTFHFPDHIYLMGGVSISDRFSTLSKSLIVNFAKKFYYDSELAKYIHPSMPYIPELPDLYQETVMEESLGDLNKFDHILEDLEPESMRMPVLLKKYLKQNAKVIAFNIDPSFNNAIDGLLYLKIEDLPEATVAPVREEFAIWSQRQQDALLQNYDSKL